MSCPLGTLSFMALALPIHSVIYCGALFTYVSQMSVFIYASRFCAIYLVSFLYSSDFQTFSFNCNHYQAYKCISKYLHATVIPLNCPRVLRRNECVVIGSEVGLSHYDLMFCIQCCLPKFQLWHRGLHTPPGPKIVFFQRAPYKNPFLHSTKTRNFDGGKF